MSYAILRLNKIKSLSGSLGNHIDRCTSDGELCYPSNIQDRAILNNIHWDKNGQSYTQKEWANYCKKTPFQDRIQNEIKSRYKIQKNIRKDAVKAIDYIMTSDNAKMAEIFSDENLVQSWMKDNKTFLSETYGEENVLSMHLHLDETTPHLHAVIVPITNDGRLSAKEFINGRKSLAEQQTRYAELMEKYGMQRGEAGSKTKHEQLWKKDKPQHTQIYER
ncbi:MobV family relaxase [Aquimarina agarilytica]|uniref:MobV family relaxase n=1 Tax=Aquimarina agarilytica TaxID=1087449 RepID=UPI00028831B6|nr:MobV family relaxase [Aquimarina agarilytica]